jgi:HD-GYP domain-containing protein (c-di-GMP phosphodiesterase class II)
MHTVFILEADKAFQEVLTINVIKNYQVDLKVIESLSDMTEEIISTPGIFIVRESLCPPDELNHFVAQVKLGHKGIKVLVLGDNTYEPWIFKMPADSSWKTVVDRVGSILDIPKRNFEQVVDKYLSIPINYFLSLKLDKLDTDIYLRIKKAEHEFQFVKRFKADDSFIKEDVQKYLSMGVTDFYVTRDSYVPLIERLTTNLLQQMSHANDQVELIANVYEVTKERLVVLGIDETTIQLVESSIKGMEKAIGEKNTLLNYLNNLKNNKTSFAFSHSYLSCLLLNRILKSFEWDSKIVREKITYLCYFHDISLPSDKLVAISSTEELKNSQLKPIDENSVLNHALVSANTLDSFPQVPMGVSQLIKEHHGSKTGNGFPDKMFTTISPIAIMFIVVESFVKEFLLLAPAPTKEEVEQVLRTLSAKYTKGTYAQTIKILKKAILNSE